MLDGRFSATTFGTFCGTLGTAWLFIGRGKWPTVMQMGWKLWVITSSENGRPEERSVKEFHTLNERIMDYRTFGTQIQTGWAYYLSCIYVAWYNFHISHKQKIVSAALSLVFILDITKKEESAKHALFRNHDSLQKILYSKLILTFIKLCTLKYPTLASSAFVYPEGFAYLNILDATFVCTLST